MKSRQGLSKYCCVPYQVIEAMLQGDPKALSRILSHYDAYILEMTEGLFFDETGAAHKYVDYNLYDRLRSKLAYAITLKFKTIR